MLLGELDHYFRNILAIDEMSQTDNSMNGIQVGQKDQEVHRVAFAVDACVESFRRAAEWDADVVFVHHGLFWGQSIRITGSHYLRVRLLLDKDIALYAAHLPLDMHPEIGNNAGMAGALGLQDIEPFGVYKGVEIGLRGLLKKTRSMDEVLEALFLDRNTCNALLPFGSREIVSVGILSGGGTRELDQAIAAGLDLYITGDADHQTYHLAMEEKINLISGGHYQTEVWGVKLLSEKLAAESDLAVRFIDVPTGL